MDDSLIEGIIMNKTNKVDILGGYVATYRNNSGDQVITVCNTDDNSTASLSMSQNDMYQVIEMLKDGGWKRGEL